MELALPKLLLVNDIFFLSLDLQIRAGVGDTEQRIALILQIGTHAHTFGLIDFSFGNQRRTGSADPGAAGKRKL